MQLTLINKLNEDLLTSHLNLPVLILSVKVVNNFSELGDLLAHLVMQIGKQIAALRRHLDDKFEKESELPRAGDQVCSNCSYVAPWRWDETIINY